MILLLPPSETKRDQPAAGARLDLAALSFSELTNQRAAALAALQALMLDGDAARAALRLGRTQDAELARNRRLHSAAVQPAIDLYTGVLFDALDAGSLSPAGLRFARDHIVVHSALFGLVRGGDPLPPYRLSHDSRLPGMRLRTHWKHAIADVLARQPGLVVDARSDSYAVLGPAPESAWALRVVTEHADGRRVALSHVNKAAKGRFARAVSDSALVHETAESLVTWARAQGIGLEIARPGVLELIV